LYPVRDWGLVVSLLKILKLLGNGDNTECFELRIGEVEVSMGMNGAGVGTRYMTNWSSGVFLP